MAELRLVIAPRDGTFFKDGRGWHSNAAGRGRALDWPFPPTVLGALRTAWGRHLEDKRQGKPLEPAEWVEQTRGLSLGVTLPLRRLVTGAEAGVQPWAIEHRLWPCPLDALYLETKSILRLDPVAPVLPTLGTRDDPAREALWRPVVEDPAKPEPSPPWWTDEDFVRWLGGGDVAWHAKKVLDALRPSRRTQVSVTIDRDTGTARQGLLYETEVVEPFGSERDDGGSRRLYEWAMGAALHAPEGASVEPFATLTLGGDRRLARAEQAAPGFFDLPVSLAKAFEKGAPGLRLVLVTPACFAEGWLPDGFRRAQEPKTAKEIVGALAGVDGEVVLRSALVSRPAHVSGWDLAAGGKPGNRPGGQPKPTRRLVPAGSVYYFVKRSGQPFTKGEAAGLWLAAIGKDNNEGLGRVAPGVWQPASRVA